MEKTTTTNVVKNCGFPRCLTVGSMAIECMDMPIETPYLPRRVENEITESILRDRNHVSIVQWELFNEIRRPVLANMLKPMALKARKLDPTRMILDESGGWAEGAGGGVGRGVSHSVRLTIRSKVKGLSV